MEERVRLGPLDDFLGYHLRRASAVAHADFRRAMAGTGLRQVLFGILSIIAANPGINQGSIGRALGIKGANMVSLINEMLDADMVTRTVAPDDRRAFSFTLTDKGRRTFERAMRRVADQEKRLFGALSAEERTTFLALLGKIEVGGR